MSYLLWPVRAATFLAWFLLQIFISNFHVLHDILNARDMSVPQVAAYRSRCDHDWEVAALSIAIALTPGSLVLATEQEGDDWVLYVHDMYAASKQDANASVARLERRLLGALRPHPLTDEPPADPDARAGTPRKEML